MADFRIEYLTRSNELQTVVRLMHTRFDCQLYCEAHGLQFISAQQVK